MDMEINLDLGRDLALEGEGITTRLEGELTVRSATIGSDPFSVFGEVRTVEGRYRAWGQALNIETGVVRFNGSYTNPPLDLLAIRPQIEVRAGVHVTGTLLAPRVQLYSEPELPEGEKLSGWCWDAPRWSPAPKAPRCSRPRWAWRPDSSAASWPRGWAWMSWASPTAASPSASACRTSCT